MHGIHGIKIEVVVLLVVVLVIVVVVSLLLIKTVGLNQVYIFW
jgi:hypothetical protein